MKSAAKHTAGPWDRESTVIYSPDAKAVVAAVSELRAGDLVRFSPVSLGSPDYKECVANAILIAAAPDLLNSLKETLRMLEAAYRDLGMQLDQPRVLKAKAAIAKAEGK